MLDDNTTAAPPPEETVTEPPAATPADTPADSVTGAVAEDKISVASQRQLIWWRFRKHRLAMVGAMVVAAFYLATLGADFLAYAPADYSNGTRTYVGPQPVHVFDGDGPWLYVRPIKSQRDPVTLQIVHQEDETSKIPIHLFARGYHYKFLGLIPSDIHLIGTSEKPSGKTLFLLGTDAEGRDVYSRLVLATRTSLTIGLAGVVLSLLLGLLLGGISGYYGGIIDSIIQRMIEVLQSIPTIPLWMGLAAAVPHDWSVWRIYFVLTLILSLVGWPELARVVRGRFLQVRGEDFVLAAELVGCRPRRVIFSHMMPLFTSHIIASTTLALPGMIVAETALSFLGLGLRDPAVSWGVMLQQAQNIQSIALSPWMLLPVIPVVVAILAFNFVGDGLRDAADPYS